MVSVVHSRMRRDYIDSFSDSISSICTPQASELKPDFKIEHISLSESTASFPASGSQSQLPQLPKPNSVFVSAFIPSRARDTANSTIQPTSTYSFDAADTV